MGEDTSKGFLVLGFCCDGWAERGNGEHLGITETWVSGEVTGVPKASAPRVDAFFAVGVNQSGWFGCKELNFIKLQLNLGLREVKAG